MLLLVGYKHATIVYLEETNVFAGHKTTYPSDMESIVGNPV